MEWAELLGQFEGQKKQKLTALDKLQTFVQENVVSKEQVSSLLDVSGQLLCDNNFKVALKLLNCWESIAQDNRDVIKPYVNALLPHVVERLGATCQEVRQAACNLLLELLQVLKPDTMMEKLGRFWGHKSWRVRHGLLQFVAEAVSTTGEAALMPPRDESNWVLHHVIQLVGDPESAVRDAAVECLEEVYKVYGEQLLDFISRHNLRPAHVNSIYARLQQLGADVAPTVAISAATDHSPARSQKHSKAARAGSVVDEFDTASSVPEEGADQHCYEPSVAVNGARRQKQQPAEENSQSLLETSNNWTAQAAPGGTAKSKRGGYKDGGGISSDGALPQAQALCVSSERELHGEMEKIVGLLSKGATAVDWEKRVSLMVRLEGLVIGGAAGSFEACFLEHLRQLRDPILEQLSDRRSAVARQAAHLMEVLAAALGPRFEPYAAAFLSALFKTLVITVQVVSEAADSAARGICHHCHTPKLVPCVCDVLTKDKSAKLRKHCSVFLLQILEDWEPQEYYHYLDNIEAAISASAQDALGETRMAGRNSFAAYASQMPERATALLRRFDSSLQQKLHDAVSQYTKGAHLQSGATLGRPHSGKVTRPRSAGSAAGGADHLMGPPPAKPPRSSRVGGTYQRAPLNANFAGTGGADFVTILAPPAPPSMGGATAVAAAASKPSRKSVAGMPMRILGPSLDDEEVAAAPPPAPAPASGAAIGRRRTSVMPQRVLYQPEPLLKLQIPAGSAKAPSVPNSPDSVAQSESSIGGASSVGGTDGFRGHPHGFATRLFQHPKQHAVQQPPTAGGNLSRSSTADDTQLLNVLRDQQQQQYQLCQERLAAQPGSHTTMSMAASIAAAGAGLASVQQQPQRPATLGKAVAGVLANPKDWKERVDKIQALSAVLMRQADAEVGPEAYLELEKALPKLLVASDDAHFKVSLAALAALQVCINTAPHVVETQLDKLMPLLFLKLCAAKQQVRSAAEGALQACALRLGADLLLPALVRSLDAMKQPAARVSVMEFCVLFLGEGKVAGVPSTAGPLRQWISKNIPLVLDKNPNVRQMAARALGTMYNIDPQSVSVCLTHASTQEVLAVQRSLAVAEAKAAAEEMEGAGMAGNHVDHIHTWAQRGHWGTHGGDISASSSMDLSATGVEAAGLAGVSAAVADISIAAEHSSSHAGAQVLQVVHQPATIRGGSMNRTADAALYSQQQQHWGYDALQQQQIAEVPASANSSPGAAAGMAGPTLRDVLGRPVPAGYSSMTPAATVTPAPGHLPAAAHPSTAVTAAYSSNAAGDQAQLYTTPFPVAATGGMSNSALVAQDSAADVAASMPGEWRTGAAVGNSAQYTESGIAHSTAAAAAAAAAAAGDANSQARHLTVLVHRLQSRPAEDVLSELAACAGVICQQAWQENFSKVLLAGLSAAQHSRESIRELAFMLVLALAQHQSNLFEPVLDVVLQPLLQGCADESREVAMAAQSALEMLMSVMPPSRCVDILAHKLPSEAATNSGTAVDGEVLCATIRCLQMVCRQMVPAELLSVAPTQLLPGIFAAFHHQRPDVRKAVVFCLVDIWLAAGEGLTPYLASLSTSQLKLLTIYYNRTLSQRQQHQVVEQ